MKGIFEDISAKFTVTAKEFQRDDLAFVTLPKEEAVDAVTWLRDARGFRHLVLLSVVDYIERDVFQLTYILHDRRSHSDIGVRTEISRKDASMQSIHHLWAAAKVYQREIREMYGIDFPGSPEIDEPMILEGWDSIPPMRREFDTRKYSEETFYPREGRSTLDPERYMAEKSYAGEDEVKRGIKDLVRRNTGGTPREQAPEAGRERRGPGTDRADQRGGKGPGEDAKGGDERR